MSIALENTTVISSILDLLNVRNSFFVFHIIVTKATNSNMLSTLAKNIFEITFKITINNSIDIFSSVRYFSPYIMIQLNISYSRNIFPPNFACRRNVYGIFLLFQPPCHAFSTHFSNRLCSFCLYNPTLQSLYSHSLIIAIGDVL